MTLQVRRDENTGIDEVIARAADIHVERMNDGSWWIGLTEADGRVHHLTLSTVRNARITANLEEDVG